MIRAAMRTGRSLPVARPIVVLVAALLVLAVSAVAAQAQFQVGLQDPGFGPTGTAAQKRAASSALQAVDGSVVRVTVDWASIAPGFKTVAFRPSNPGDPRYRWAPLDAAVRTVAADHLHVLFDFVDAPSWAEGPPPIKPDTSPGAWDPNPAQFTAFVHAVAQRYSGTYPDPLAAGATLPQVTYWEPWNEPNIPGNFSAPNPVTAYRILLNRAYAVLKALSPANVVVLGGLAPVSSVPGSIPPLTFAADLLCVHKAGGSFAATRSCPNRADFDVMGMHPYSLAVTPTMHADKAGDILVADIGKLTALVAAADRLHADAPRIRHRVWVTEFAWPTNPPDGELGDADSVAARYVAYSMFEMWRSGVSLVIWQTVLDSRSNPLTGGGLYQSSGQPKLTLQAFAFPVVASVNSGHAYVWGRAPVSHPVVVLVQRAVGRVWHTFAQVRTGADGVFSARTAATGNGLYRAQVVNGPTSLAYNSRPIPAKRTHIG